MSGENNENDGSKIESANEQLFTVDEESLQAEGGNKSETETPSLTSEEESTCPPSGLAAEEGERPSCRHCNTSTLRPVEGAQAQCMFCRGEASTTNVKNTTATVENPVATEGHLLRVFTSSYALSLPSLPGISLEDETCSTPQQQVESLVTGRSHDAKTPVHNVCQFSAQTPSPGLTIRILLFERTFPERNEKVFILYAIPEGECLVYEEICREFKEAALQQGYSRQIPFSVNNHRSREFYTVYIQEQISVSFDIENRYQENFIALDQREEFVFRVPVIESESQNRVAKGAKCSFRVQCVGEPGKPCQEQGIVTLTTDSSPSEQTTLFFSIAIWSSMGIRLDGQ